MRRLRVFAGIFCVLLSATAVAQAAPLEAYGQLPSEDNLAISPDGKNLAVEATINGQRAVLINSLSDGKALAALKIGDQKLRYLMWADADHLLIAFSVTHTALGVMGGRAEYLQLNSYSLSEHLQMQMMKNVSNSMNTILGGVQPRTVDGKTVVYLTGVTFLDRTGVRGLFAVDMASGRTTLVERGNPNTEGWVIDEHGTVIARSEYDETAKRWSLKLRRGDDWQEVFSTGADIETPTIEGIGPDGASLILTVPENGAFVTKQIALADGKWQTPPDMGDYPTGMVEDPVTHRIIGTQQMTVKTDYHFFLPADQKAWHSLAAAFQDENVTLVSWSNDRKRVVIRVDGARDGAEYHLVDLTAMRADGLGPVYTGIDPTDVAEVKLISYKAADGTTIPAYLTLPAGKDPKNLPLIVLAHGGPASRDDPGFDWWSQALASRGYAVLQPQFRGSDGFGWAFLSSGFGQWGRKMQTDLSDGVRFLAKEGTVDAGRVCIVGASYGGYAALAGPTLDPGVYRCAVSVAGISDPRGFLRWRETQDRTRDDSTLRYWKRFMGVESNDDPKLMEISPAAHAATAAVPILLIHGKDDTVVPLDQSVTMESALRAAGKPVTFVRLSGEDHWLSRAETRMQMLGATVEFLEKNNPPN